MTDKNYINETFEEDLSLLACGVDKISTLSKILHQMLSDDTDFEKKDSLNISSLIVQELGNLNIKIRDLENTYEKNKISCR